MKSLKVKKVFAKLGAPTTQAVPRTFDAIRGISNADALSNVITSSPAGPVGRGQAGSATSPIVAAIAATQGLSTTGDIPEIAVPKYEKDPYKKQNDKQYAGTVAMQVPGSTPSPEELIPTTNVFGDFIVDPNSDEYKSSVTLFRPEIISLTKFNPLYDDQLNNTQYGLLFDSLVETLRKSDVDARNFVKSSPEKQQEIVDQNEKLKDDLSSFNSKINDLFSFIKSYTFSQNSLNISSSEFSPQEFLSLNFQDSQAFSNYNSLSSYVTKLDKKLTLNKCLNRNLSYPDKSSDINGDFYGSPPTRSWVTALQEMKWCIFSHSRKSMKVKMDSQIQFADFSNVSKTVIPDIKAAGRLTSNNLLNIGPAANEVDITAGESNHTRFETLKTYSDLFQDKPSYVSTMLHVAMKEIRQRACLKALDKDADISFDGKNSKVQSLIMRYDNVANKPAYSRNQQETYTGTKLYDVAYFGDINDRSKTVFSLERQKIPNVKNADDYFFKGFGSQDFFSQILQKGEFNVQKFRDYSTVLSEIKKQFMDYISNSGILPVDSSKLSSLEYSTDPVTFFEDIASKFVSDSGAFLPIKGAATKANVKGYVEGDEYTALTLFALASGNALSVSRMKSLDLQLKKYAQFNQTFDVDATERTAELNIAILKNNLYSYIRNRAATDQIEPQANLAKSIFHVLTNVADVVGGGLATNDDFVDSSDYYQRGQNEGDKNSVLIAQNLGGDFDSGDGNNKIGPHHEGIAEPRNYAPSDSFITWALYSIQSEPTDAEPDRNKDPDCLKYIIRLLKETKFIADIVEIMKPIVLSDLAEDFSIIFFDIICSLIGQLAPIQDIKIYIDDYQLEEDEGEASTAFSKDNEIRSAIVMFTTFPKIENKEVIYATKQSITNKLVEETNTLISLSFSTLNVLSKLTQYFSDIESKLSIFKNDVAGFFGNYLDNDPRKFSLIMNEQHLSLIYTSFKDFYDSYNSAYTENENKAKSDELFNKYLNGLPYSPKMVPILRQFFKNEEYTLSKGNNKQIITVGIPQGLLNDLFKKSFEKSFYKNVAKINDIFKISIYKIDLLNDDIVYYPQEFLFETSRFVVKDYSKITDINSVISLSTDDYLFKSFATRNFNIFSLKNEQDSFFSETKPVSIIQEAFPSAEYGNLLTVKQMSSILKNHIISFILENYLNVLSGIKFNESSFPVANPQDIELLYKEFIGTPLPKPKEKASLAPSERYTKSVPSDMLIKKILYPKVFDRVFNIIFDPDSFVVNETKTSSSIIQQKILKGILRLNQSNQYVDVDKSLRDPALNSYFINIDSFDPFP